jgi:hypothetical protein
MATNYQILRNDEDALIVKINPIAYYADLLYQEELPPNVEIAFNTNYYWRGPLGVFKKGSWHHDKTKPSKGVRPTIHINGTDCEAGPLLLRNGTEAYQKSIADGMYQSDTYRTTRHTAVGYTSANKLIVAYFEKINLKDMAKAMRDADCVWAMKCDGGHSAYLKVGDIVRGLSKVPYCGVTLISKGGTTL